MKDFSALGRIFKSSPEEIYQLYQNFRNKYENIRNAGNVKNILMSVLQGDDAAAVGRLFQIDNYSITGYISNYIKELQGQYYKQRWYIYSDDSGSKPVRMSNGMGGCILLVHLIMSIVMS